MAGGIGPQPLELLCGVGWDVGNPESRQLGRNEEGQLGFGWVVRERVDVFPGAAIIADDRRRVFGNCALVGTVVVLAAEVYNVKRQFFRAGAVDTEVIPVGLAIAAVLVPFPLRAEAEVSLRDLLDTAQTAAFEIRVHGDGRG